MGIYIYIYIYMYMHRILLFLQLTGNVQRKPNIPFSRGWCRSMLEKSTEGPSGYKSFDAIPAEAFEVSGHAGAFYIFTSNVDGHHYDWFLPNELRECHGNVELYQCSFGRARCGPGIWRAPMDFRFSVDPQSMLALAGANPLKFCWH